MHRVGQERETTYIACVPYRSTRMGLVVGTRVTRQYWVQTTPQPPCAFMPHSAASVCSRE